MSGDFDSQLKQGFRFSMQTIGHGHFDLEYVLLEFFGYVLLLVSTPAPPQLTEPVLHPSWYILPDPMGSRANHVVAEETTANQGQQAASVV